MVKSDCLYSHFNGRLITTGFVLQKRYFSCKKPFDIHALNSTYTQVSNTEEQYERLIHAPVLTDRCSELGHVFVHRCRAKVCLRPWTSWTCCLATLRTFWLPSGRETTSETNGASSKRAREGSWIIALFQSVTLIVVIFAPNFWFCNEMMSVALRTGHILVFCPVDKFPDHTHTYCDIYFYFMCYLLWPSICVV